MATWVINVNFGDGSGEQDITALVLVDSIYRCRTLHNNLSPTVDTLSFTMHRNAAYLNSLMIYKDNKPTISVTKDGSDYFTGNIRPNFSVDIESTVGDIKVECVDYGEKLNKKINTTFAWVDYKVADATTKTASIVHQLLVLAGFDVDDDIDIPTIDKTIDYFVNIGGTDARSYWDVITKLLSEFGYVWYFDPSGVFHVYDLFPSDTSTSDAFDNSNMEGKLSVIASLMDYEGIDVAWYPHVTETGVTVFSDKTGQTEALSCNIELEADGYYPDGSGSTTVYSEYEYDGGTVIIVNSAALDATYDTGITPSFTSYYRRADISFHNGAASAKNITKFDVTGDVTYQGDQQKTECLIVAGTEKILDVETEFITESTDADRLAIGLARYYKYSDIKYVLYSRTAYALGGFVDIQDMLTGMDNRCVIVKIEDVDATTGKMKYSLVGIEEYETETTTQEATKFSTSNPNTSATTQTATTASESVVTPAQKIAYLTLWYQINGDGADTGSYWTVKAQATALGLSTTALTGKYDALYAYLFTSPAVLGSIPGENVTITPATWQAVWAEYYSAEREIQSAVNQSAIMPSQADLEVYYSFDGPEVEGQTVDNSGNYIHADVEGATQVNSAQGLAYDFDGVDDSIVTEELPEISGGLTLAAMCTPDTLNDDSVGDMIISHDDEPVYLSVLDDGTVRFSFLDDGDDQRVLTYAAGWVAGARHFVEATHDGTTARIILDGVIVASDATYALGTIPAGSWRIGAQTDSLDYPFDGVIDEVAIWSRALEYREDLGLWRVGGVQQKRYQAYDEDSILVDGAAIVSEAAGGLSDMRLDLSQLRFRSRVSGSAPWEEQAWMRRRTDSTLFDLSVSGYGYGRGGLLSNLGMIWLDKTQPFTTTGIRSAAYGNGVWVAVGQSGKIARSTDGGETWGSLITNPFGTAIIYSIAYGNGVWIAVGQSGMIARSTNGGETWGSLITNPFGGSAICSIAYGNGVWVAVGQSGKIARSTDGGETWGSLITNPFGTSIFYSIAYGNGVWVAVGQSGKIARSTDGGETWGSLITNPFGISTIYSIAYGNGVWIAVGTSGRIARSTDGGETWGSLITNPFGTSIIYSIAYGNGVWVAVGQSGKIARSTDGGVTWTQQSYSVSGIQNPFGTNGYFSGVAYGNDRFITAGLLNSDSSGILCVSEWQEAGSGIVERGENSNGNYIKFSDGTLICWKSIIFNTSINSAYGPIYRSDPHAASNWAAEFTDVPSYNINSDHPSYHSWVTIQGTPSSTQASSFMLLRATAIASAQNYNVRFIAIGRWK